LVALQGIIILVDWDENGNVTAVAVSTYDEEEYLIDNQEKGEELLCTSRGRLAEKSEKRRELSLSA
jgi:5S rRNA maturation endonuclease (ribonuclease M5)